MMWGTRIGAVAVGTDGICTFEYDRDFLASGIEVAPLTMPLSSVPYRFPALSRDTFSGLPGMLADSLPDRFGNAIIDSWLARQGRSKASFGVIERLCYTGSRGMGALEFMPATGPGAPSGDPVEVSALRELAAQVLQERASAGSIAGGLDKSGALQTILQVGTSAGGARAKAVIAWNESTGEVRSGQADAPDGFEHWLLKFDGVAENRDRELADPLGFGALEYAYSRMAAAAGVTMARCRLFEESGRRHFMTRRFDRPAPSERLHMLTLAGLAHFDFNAPGAHSYEEVFELMARLGLGVDQREQYYRRMLFNVVARNQDDHVKNTAFLMDRRGEWRLSPAYDVCWSYNPAGQWTSQHQMTIAGKRDGFTRDDLLTAARTGNIAERRARNCLDEVVAAAVEWERIASDVGVDERLAQGAGRTFRIDI
jgi:serine/threonine-protein kinase HipA